MPTSTITPRMFRHFAVVTVSLTIVLAILADGSGRDALEAEVRANQQRIAAQQADREAGRKTSGWSRGMAFKDSRSNTSGSFSADPGVAPTTYVRTSRKPNHLAQAHGRASPWAAEDEPVDDFAPSTSADKRQGEGKDVATKEEIDKLLDASRRRSGKATTGELEDL